MPYANHNEAPIKLTVLSHKILSIKNETITKKVATQPIISINSMLIILLIRFNTIESAKFIIELYSNLGSSEFWMSLDFCEFQ